jgi:PTH1 family peptidyl-tRNA hydrolase
MVADMLAHEAGAAWKINRDKTLVCEARLARSNALLVKPQTYMNLSGRAVAPLVKKHAVDPSSVVVIHDDMDLILGRVRIKLGGGDGGHRGVRSMAECLGTKDFVRVRLGVGRPPMGVAPEEFVLSTFLPDERGQVDDLVRSGASAVISVITDGWETARNQVHAEKSIG